MGIFLQLTGKYVVKLLLSTPDINFQLLYKMIHLATIIHSYGHLFIRVILKTALNLTVYKEFNSCATILQLIFLYEMYCISMYILLHYYRTVVYVMHVHNMYITVLLTNMLLSLLSATEGYCQWVVPLKKKKN